MAIAFFSSPGAGVLGLADEGIDEIGLAARGEEAPDEVVDLGLVAGLGEVGDDALAARRHRADGGDREVAEDGQRQGAGNRRRRHHEEVGHGALAREREALEHAEAMLLVDDGRV